MTDHELARAMFGRDANASLAALATGVAMEDQDGDTVRVRLDGNTDSADGEAGIVMPCAVTNIKEGSAVQVLMSRTSGEVGFNPIVLGNVEASRAQDEATQGVELKFEETMEELGVTLETGVSIGPGLIATYVSEQTEDKATRTELTQTSSQIRSYVLEQTADKVSSSELTQESNSIRSYVREQVADKVTSTELTQTSSALEVRINSAQSDASDAKSDAADAKSTANATSTLIRAYSDGVLTCKSGNKVGALVNASGSFDIVSLSGLTPQKTLASFGTSSAIGSSCSATGDYSLAMGYNVSTPYSGSMAIGRYLQTQAPNQLVVGSYNKAAGDLLFIVGCGTSASNRKNALTVSWDGWLGLNGGLSVPVGRFNGVDDDGTTGLAVGHDAFIGGKCTAASHVTASDRRIKTHIGYLAEDPESIEFVRSLKPVLYEKDGARELGFYAQDVKEAEPEGWDTDTVSSCASPRYEHEILTLSYPSLIAPLVAYAQHLEERVAALEEKLADMQ